jgi:KUP system potassium uptake protein
MSQSVSGESRANTRRLLLFSLAALGVVYGDIGTSPLYAMRECFHGAHAIAPDRANILGVLSLIFWALVVVISVKYLAFILRADNRGEGGILALSALVQQVRPRVGLLVLGLFGAALLYADGMITPAITVLGAVEGLEVALPRLHAFVQPIAIAIIVGVFVVQRHGTARIGALFGPVMVAWFVAIAALGVMHISREPGVLAALNPVHGAEFLLSNGWHGFIILGAIFLVVTGGEALYADIGHFGVQPIRLGWFAVALPGLLLNYLGQGALLLREPAAAVNPFYRMAPEWGLYPLIALATAAAIIASQALITGAFSLTMHAVQLGFCPRLDIRHTSSDAKGQIYIPLINWSLMLACIGLVMGFRSSSNLAAAYGVSITSTMLITTVLFYVVARWRWQWNAAAVGAISLVFLVIDLAFLGSNFTKILHGGWFPLLVAAAVFLLMWTWRAGRMALAQRYLKAALPLGVFLNDIEKSPPVRVPGTAFFMSGNPGVTPTALLHNLRHNKVIHERVVILNVRTEEIPHIPPSDRLHIDCLAHGFWRIAMHFGFMDEPDVPRELQRIAGDTFTYDPAESSFFLGRESILARSGTSWRQALFGWMARQARDATAFFRLPPSSVVELGAQIEL